MKDETDHSDSDESTSSECTNLQGLVSEAIDGQLRSWDPASNPGADAYWDAERGAIAVQDSLAASLGDQWLEGGVHRELYNTGPETLAFNDATLASNVVARQPHDLVFEDPVSKLGSVQSVPDFDAVNMSLGPDFGVDSKTGRVSVEAAFETNDLADQLSYTVTVENGTLSGRASGLLYDESLFSGIGHMDGAAELIDQAGAASLSSEMPDVLRTDVLQAGLDNKNYLTGGHDFADDNLTLLESQLPVQSVTDETVLTAGLGTDSLKEQVMAGGLDTNRLPAETLATDRELLDTGRFMDDVGLSLNEMRDGAFIKGTGAASRLAASSGGTASRNIFQATSPPVQTAQTSGKRWERKELVELIEEQLENYHYSPIDKTREFEQELTRVRSDIAQLRSDLGERRFQQAYSTLGIKLTSLLFMLTPAPEAGAALSAMAMLGKTLGIYGENHMSNDSE